MNTQTRFRFTGESPGRMGAFMVPQTLHPPFHNTHRWGGMPVVRVEFPSLDDAISNLPRFSTASLESMGFEASPHRKLVVADPQKGDRPNLIAMVSPTYHLVQHHEILEAAKAFLKQIECTPSGPVGFEMTRNGERILASIDLGDSHLCKPDGHPLSLRLHCTNTVDGSGSMCANLGWFRLVCSNGMRRLESKIRSTLRHSLASNPNLVFEPLAEHYRELSKEYEKFETWGITRIDLESVRTWVDGSIAEAWGKLAAARLWSIATTGRDAVFAPPFAALPPTRRKVKRTIEVPGSPPESRTLYDVAQAASWIASRRTNIEESQLMQQQIDPLLAKLN